MWSDVAKTKSFKTANAAANMDTTLSTEFVVNVTGMRFMIKVLVSAVFLVMRNVSSISARRGVSAYLNTSSSRMEFVIRAQFIPLTVNSPKNVNVMKDTS